MQTHIFVLCGHSYIYPSEMVTVIHINVCNGYNSCIHFWHGHSYIHVWLGYGYIHSLLARSKSHTWKCVCHGHRFRHVWDGHSYSSIPDSVTVTYTHLMDGHIYTHMGHGQNYIPGCIHFWHDNSYMHAWFCYNYINFLLAWFKLLTYILACLTLSQLHTHFWGGYSYIEGKHVHGVTYTSDLIKCKYVYHMVTVIYIDSCQRWAQ